MIGLFLYQRSEDKQDIEMELRCLRPFSMESDAAVNRGVFTRFRHALASQMRVLESKEDKGTTGGITFVAFLKYFGFELDLVKFVR